MVSCAETLAGSIDESDEVLTSALINCTTLLEMNTERKGWVVNIGNWVVGIWMLVRPNETAELELVAVSWVRNGVLV